MIIKSELRYFQQSFHLSSKCLAIALTVFLILIVIADACQSTLIRKNIFFSPRTARSESKEASYLFSHVYRSQKSEILTITSEKAV